MSNKTPTAANAADTPGPQSGVLLVLNDELLSQQLVTLFEGDVSLKRRVATGSLDDAAKYRLLVIDGEILTEAVTAQLETIANKPLVVVCNKMTIKLLSKLSEHGLKLRGIVPASGLKTSLWQVGQFARLLVTELNALSEEAGQLQQVGELICLESEGTVSRQYTSLFVDPAMRHFLTRLSDILQRLRNSPRQETAREWRNRHARYLDQLFASPGQAPSRQKAGASTTRPASDKLKAAYDALVAPAATAASPIHTLLRGETGSGKTLIAAWMAQYLGEDNLMQLNVSSLPQTLVESELFGSLPGSFTGAVGRPGVLLRAYGGAIFLDEIGDLTPDTQAKLLVYLDNGTFWPLGWNDARPVTAPCHVIAATNRPLEEMMARGTFRRDLYHRFTYHLTIPALRERKSDMPLLVDLLLQDPRVNPGKAVTAISHRALTMLAEQPLPGNFRELEDLLGRAAGLAHQEASEPLLEKHLLKAMLETRSSTY